VGHGLLPRQRSTAELVRNGTPHAVRPDSVLAGVFEGVRAASGGAFDARTGMQPLRPTPRRRGHHRRLATVSSTTESSTASKACGPCVKHGAHPRGHRGSGQRWLAMPSAPGQVSAQAVGVGIDGAGALGLCAQRKLPVRQKRVGAVGGEPPELRDCVHAPTARRPPCPRFSCRLGDEGRRRRRGPHPTMTSDRIPGRGLGSSRSAHEIASSQSSRWTALVRLSPDNPALSGHSIKFVNAFRLGIRRFRA